MKPFEPQIASWLLIVVSLSGDQATLRMRIWRILKALGAVVLRDGVYLLPDRPNLKETVELQMAEADAESALILASPLSSQGAERDAEFVALFDRSESYAEVIAGATSLLDEMSVESEQDLGRNLRQVRRAMENVIAIDYFPGTARTAAERAVAVVEAAYNRKYSSGEPSPVAATVAVLDAGDYQGKKWATREHLWVDRVASAWLIRRFIDRRAGFVWIKKPKDCPKNALGFDFDGATFTHVGERVTFQVLLTSFGLEGDPGLARLGNMVHYLDVGGVPVAEAAGFEALLHGIRARSQDDDAFLAKASVVLDHLHVAYARKPEAPARRSRRAKN
jgi:hypothetical protein